MVFACDSYQLPVDESFKMPINLSEYSGRYAVAASFDTLCIYNVAHETRAWPLFASLLSWQENGLSVPRGPQHSASMEATFSFTVTRMVISARST